MQRPPPCAVLETETNRGWISLINQTIDMTKEQTTLTHCSHRRWFYDPTFELPSYHAHPRGHYRHDPILHGRWGVVRLPASKSFIASRRGKRERERVTRVVRFDKQESGFTAVQSWALVIPKYTHAQQSHLHSRYPRSAAMFQIMSSFK